MLRLSLAKMSSMIIDVQTDFVSMQELLDTLPKRGSIYGLKEGTKVRHSLVAKKRNVSRGNTWIGIIVNGVIYHAGETYSRPAHFVRAHYRSNGGRSASGFEMEVLYKDVWIPYSIYVK